MNLDMVFQPFWDCRITDCQYDIFNDNVVLVIQEPESEVCHKVFFRQVSSCLFLQNVENEFLHDSYSEMSSIAFKKETIPSDRIQNKWLKQYALDFNVTIEMIRSALLIKAGIVEVDSIMYNL